MYTVKYLICFSQKNALQKSGIEYNNDWNIKVSDSCRARKLKFNKDAENIRILIFIEKTLLYLSTKRTMIEK